jgi:hypothetical protein
MWETQGAISSDLMGLPTPATRLGAGFWSCMTGSPGSRLEFDGIPMATQWRRDHGLHRPGRLLVLKPLRILSTPPICRLQGSPHASPNAHRDAGSHDLVNSHQRHAASSGVATISLRARIEGGQAASSAWAVCRVRHGLAGRPRGGPAAPARRPDSHRWIS